MFPFIELSEEEESSETSRSTCISTDNHDCEVEVPASDDESEISPDRPRRSQRTTRMPNYYGMGHE